MTHGDARWRQTKADDLAAIQKIGNAIHPDLLERPEVFAEKLSLFPEGCLVLEGDRVLGYAFAHPWRLNNIPKLNEFLLRLPPEPECLLIHDVAILEPARRRGAASSLLDRIVRLAMDRNLTHLALVAVYGSHEIWGRLGFDVVDCERLAHKLASYGETAQYMVRPLK